MRKPSPSLRTVLILRITVNTPFEAALPQKKNAMIEFHFHFTQSSTMRLCFKKAQVFMYKRMDLQSDDRLACVTFSGFFNVKAVTPKTDNCPFER